MSQKKKNRQDARAPAPPPAQPEAPAEQPLTRTHVVFLVLVVLLGGALCFWGLDNQSLELDELWTWCMSDYPTMESMFTDGKAKMDIHPPLHHMLYYAVEKYVGTSPMVLRLPSAIAGFLAVPVVFLLGRRLYSNRVGLIAAGLLAVLYQEVFYSQQARANALLVFLAALSVWLGIAVVRALVGAGRARWWAHVGFGATVFALGYMHYFGLLLVGLEGIAAALIVLVRRPRNVLLLGFYYVPLLAGFAVWVSIWIWGGAEGSHFDAPSLGRIVYWIAWALNPYWTWGAWASWAGVALIAWAAARDGFDGFRPAENRDRPATPYAGLLLLLWLAAPFAIIYASALVGPSTYNERNFTICLPALALLLARGIDRLPGPKGVGAGVAVALVAGLLFGLIFVTKYYSTPRKDQFREAVYWTAEKSKDPRYAGAAIVGYMCDNRFYNYYFERCGSDRRIDFRLRKEYIDEDIERLQAFVRARRLGAFWLVWAHWRPEKHTPRLEAFLKTQYTLVPSESKKLFDAEVRFYRTVPPD